MKLEGKYRYSLQFPAETVEQIQVGEFLEHAGNRKSTIIVEALHTYIETHPEILEKNCKINICTTATLDAEKIEQMIRKVVKEHLSVINNNNNKVNEITEEALSEDISMMLDNLSFFQ